MTEPRMPTITIRHRYTDAVLYEHETTQERIDSGLAMRDALEAANKARANLADANLADANLVRANLVRANLADANLAGANLADAYLADANLADANLAGANLADAYLADANLAGANLVRANLADAKLLGTRPLLQIGPIGSRCAYLTAYLTDAGVRIRAGCWLGSDTEFETRVLVEHAKAPQHRDEYLAALTLIRVHAQQWTPAEQSATREAA